MPCTLLTVRGLFKAPGTLQGKEGGAIARLMWSLNWSSLAWNSREEKVGQFSWQQLRAGGISEQGADEVSLARSEHLENRLDSSAA